jgi:aromatic ring-cleaving dioxygenase
MIKALSDNDLLVSFDVASLFTKVPISDTLELLERHFSPGIIPLFRHCLTQCFFLFNGEFYKQIDGVAMGSPISPAIANYYMKFFEEKCLATSTFRPSIWWRYVDDIFAVWPHGKEKLDIFLQHLNNQHVNISFTMELEANGCLPFLDVLLQKSPSGSLIHSVYRKPTHTNQYINAFSHNPMFQKMSTMRNLFNRSIDICHPDKLSDEIQTLKNIFSQNGYSNYQIERAMKPRNRHNNRFQITGNSSFALLPYVANISEKIARLLVKYNIKTSFSSSGKLKQFLRPAKDAIPLHAAGIYRVPCECGQVYIGQTGRLVATRLTEHRRNIRLDQPEKSAIAEHAINTLHNVKFEDTCILVKEKRLTSRLIREGIEILTHPNNFNRDEGTEISPIWLTLLS